MNPLFFPLLALSIVIDCTEAAKILAVAPLPGKSHHNFIRAITDGLAAKGHELTIYTPFVSGKNVTNVNEIQTKSVRTEKFMKSLDFNMLRSFNQVPVFGPPGFVFFLLQVADTVLDDPVVAELIKSDEQYDLVLLETFFGQEALFALGHKFQAPVVSLHCFTTTVHVDDAVGNPLGISFVPGLEVPYTDKMSFFERVHNTLRTIIFIAATKLYYMPQQEKLMRKYFNYPGSENIPPLADMITNVSLVISNTQPSVDYPKPWAQNVIAAGGAHISSTRTPLPKDLKEFMDNSKNGVIYVSFGSVVPSEQMPEDMKQGLVNAFRKLKQNVLWKLNVDTLPGLPKNVKLGKWWPQQDILAHPNCLAFITHGGFLSHLESVYFAVPHVGVPFFGDQYINVIRASERGFGVYLDQYNVTEEGVLWAVNEILSNTLYYENVKKLSRVFRDTPMLPLENAVFWIEHVIRHKGALHLMNEGRAFPYYKYLLLDVFAFMITVVVLSVFIIYKTFRCICKNICRKCKTKIVTPKKKNN